MWRLWSFTLVGCILLSMSVRMTSAFRGSRSACSNLVKVTSLSGGASTLEEEDEDSYKNNEDWWKDPLAMFSDDEDEEEEEVESPFADLKEEKNKESLESIIEANVTNEPPPQQRSPRDETMMEELYILGEPAVAQPALVAPKKKKRRAGGAVASRKKKSSSSSVSPLAVAGLLKSIVENSQGLQNLPIAQVLSAGIAAKYAVNFIHKSMETKKLEESPAPSEAHEDDGMEPDAAYNYPQEPYQESYQEQPEDQYAEQDTYSQEWEDEDQDTPLAESIPEKRRFPSFGFGKGRDGKRVSKHSLLVQVEELQQQVKSCEMERDAMEREYEQRTHQLAEVQTELATLSSTTRYLKAQLRDNEAVMDRAIRTERSRAKAELTKMKDAMLQVLEKERRSMRDQLKRQTHELQAMLVEEEG